MDNVAVHAVLYYRHVQILCVAIKQLFPIKRYIQSFVGCNFVCYKTIFFFHLVKITTKHFCGSNLLNVKDAFSQTSDTEKNRNSTPTQIDTRKRRSYNSRRTTDNHMFTSPSPSVVEGKPFSVCHNLIIINIQQLILILIDLLALFQTIFSFTACISSWCNCTIISSYIIAVNHWWRWS